MKLLIRCRIDVVVDTEPSEQKHNLCVHSSPERTSVLVSHVITADNRGEGSVLSKADSPGFTSTE